MDDSTYFVLHSFILKRIVDVDGPGKSSMCVVWDSEQGGLDPGQLALALLLTFSLKFWDLTLEKMFYEILGYFSFALSLSKLYAWK